MQTFIGTKIVQAEPQNKVVQTQGGAQNVLGYKVVYSDGYVSWSPKSVFERCSRVITEEEKKCMQP